jgi:biopolymer transport protein ExbB
MADFATPLFAADASAGTGWLFEWSGYIIAAFKFGIGVWGVYCVIWIWQHCRRRSFAKRAQEREYIEQTCQLVDEGRFEEAEALAAGPKVWFRAVPMLARVALRHRWMPTGKLQHLCKIHLENEVMAGVDSSLMHINTGIKAAPMFGLLGTVIGMIGAFGVISRQASPDASKLSGDIAFALYATAGGLGVAVVLMLLGTWAMGLKKKVEEHAVTGIQQILIHLDAARARAEQPGAYAGAH